MPRPCGAPSYSPQERHCGPECAIGDWRSVLDAADKSRRVAFVRKYSNASDWVTSASTRAMTQGEQLDYALVPHPPQPSLRSAHLLPNCTKLGIFYDREYAFLFYDKILSSVLFVRIRGIGVCGALLKDES
jgi:hypothetical protein